MCGRIVAWKAIQRRFVEVSISDEQFNPVPRQAVLAAKHHDFIAEYLVLSLKAQGLCQPHHTLRLFGLDAITDDRVSAVWANHNSQAGRVYVGGNQLLHGITEDIGPDLFSARRILGQRTFMRQLTGHGVQSREQFSYTHQSVKTMCIVMGYVVSILSGEAQFEMVWN